MVLRSEKEIINLAHKITTNSEMFGDELTNVVGDLTQLWNSAMQFGTEMSATINDWWGGNVIVTAIPTRRKHEWSF